MQKLNVKSLLKKTDEMKYHTLKWFQNRRGKTIHRNPVKTTMGKKCCDMCEKTDVFVIKPQRGMPDHAQHLFDCQNELKIEYFD